MEEAMYHVCSRMPYHEYSMGPEHLAKDHPQCVRTGNSNKAVHHNTHSMRQIHENYRVLGCNACSNCCKFLAYECCHLL